MSSSSPKKFIKKTQQSINVTKLAEEVLSGNRTALARAITLMESVNVERQKQAQELLKVLLPHSGNSLRIGITGVPGAGKSTFIEAFGTKLCHLGQKIAVLAIDPSSSLSGGSILGDKTRMDKLVREPNAFVRPSPSAGTLGGVQKKTRETILLCEAAGFDIILVETVGVGQSETALRNMVDFYMVLVLTGAGDELQGLKKGIMELCDAIIIHKADGENVQQAKQTAMQYKQMLHLLQPATTKWVSEVHCVSSTGQTGLDEVWSMLQKFQRETNDTGAFIARRQTQIRDWFHQLVKDHVLQSFYNNPDRIMQLTKLEEKIVNGEMTVDQGIYEVFQNSKLNE